MVCDCDILFDGQPRNITAGIRISNLKTVLKNRLTCFTFSSLKIFNSLNESVKLLLDQLSNSVTAKVRSVYNVGIEIARVNFRR